MCTAEELVEPPSCAGYQQFGFCGLSRDVVPFMRACNVTCGICQRKLNIRLSNTTYVANFAIFVFFTAREYLVALVFRADIKRSLQSQHSEVKDID